MSYLNLLNYGTKNFSVSTGSNSGFVTASAFSITTSGRPVMVIFGPQGAASNGGAANIQVNTPGSGNNNQMYMNIARYTTGITPDSSKIITGQQVGAVTSTSAQVLYQPWFFSFLDLFAPAGNNTYSLFIENDGSSTIAMSGVCLTAYEI